MNKRTYFERRTEPFADGTPAGVNIWKFSEERLTDRDGNPILVGSKVRCTRPERFNKTLGITLPADSPNTSDRGFVTSLEGGIVHYRGPNGYSVVRPDGCVTLGVRGDERGTMERETRETAEACKRLRRKRISSPRKRRKA